MKMMTRTELEWGPTKAAAASPRRGLVIHYDGSNQGLAGKPHEACVDYWRNTRKFHMGPKRGWVDVGYSFGACPHGQLFEGRGLNHAQAAQPGGNSTWYSVTLMSGPSERPTTEQINAVRRLRAWLMSKGVAGAVRGHRDFYATDCPGPIYPMVRDGTFTQPPEEEDDMKPEEIHKGAWEQDAIPVPWGGKDNPNWRPRSVLVDIGARARGIEAKLDVLTARIEAQSATIATLAEALAAHHQDVDAEALLARIEAAIERVTIRLEVADPAQ
jgi:N-acetylmuramoyl-L-alanine amidase